MAEMASVASGDAPTSSLERANTRKDNTPLMQHNPKTVDFASASNILNDMGPPPLCSALLLAANAACRPSSRCSLRSFDTNNDGEAPSDVVAHVDTDDCCDRSIGISEASTLHSQDEMASEHKEGNLDASGRSVDEAMDGKKPLHNSSESPLAPTNARDSPGGMFTSCAGIIKLLLYDNHSQHVCCYNQNIYSQLQSSSTEIYSGTGGCITAR